MYELAGSQQALIDGFAAEAKIGGTVAFYAALTGSVGHYGYREDPKLLPVTLGKPGGQGANGTPDQAVPAGPMALAGLLVAIAFAARRKR